MQDPNNHLFRRGSYRDQQVGQDQLQSPTQKFNSSYRQNNQMFQEAIKTYGLHTTNDGFRPNPSNYDLDKLLRFKLAGVEIAKLSKDRRTKVVALAFDDDLNLLGNGYNGFPRGVEDNLEERHMKPTKYLYSAHAEENLIAQSAKTGRSLNNSTVMIIGRHPCAACTRMLIQAGVKRLVCPRPDFLNPSWRDSNEAAFSMLREAGIETYYVEELRSDLLGLETYATENRYR